ncbi:MAG: prepilin-type N-terminal cleavage/methylation protein [Bacillales bacterium]|jgi:prepilin-type N-terminal cleavage/methylation domain-containing protein|nr:prepilin-type N-terminal cleavage/methylation protein [Bacillales bacterium]
MLRNNKGITLVELLVSMAISSIILVLIWGIYFQGAKFSKVVTNKTLLQQEANTLISNLTRIHQTSTATYMFQFSGNSSAEDLSSFTVVGDETTKIENTNFLYSIYTFDVSNSTEELITNNFTVSPNIDDFNIKIVIKDKNNPTVKYEAKTILTRIK